MINIITNFYLDQNAKRQSEINQCLRNNTDVCDNIVVLCDKKALDYLAEKNLLSDKMLILIGEGRPSYKNFFDLMDANYSGDDNINILINSDVYIDRGSIDAIKTIQRHEVFALSRYDIGHNGNLSLFNRIDSQDTWIWRGEMRNLNGADFPIGVPGCDNRIAKIFLDAGYEVLNPSMDIKTIHLHESRIRNYDRSMTVQPPYHFVEPHHLKDIAS